MKTFSFLLIHLHSSRFPSKHLPHHSSKSSPPLLALRRRRTPPTSHTPTFSFQSPPQALIPFSRLRLSNNPPRYTPRARSRQDVIAVCVAHSPSHDSTDQRAREGRECQLECGDIGQRFGRQGDLSVFGCGGWRRALVGVVAGGCRAATTEEPGADGESVFIYIRN